MTNEYGKLIQRVRKVNRKAALILARQLPLLKGRGKMPNSIGPSVNQPGADLASAFVWAQTPQGHKYWEGVEAQLRWAIK